MVAEGGLAVLCRRILRMMSFGLLHLDRQFEVVAGTDNYFTIELTTQLVHQYGKDDD